MIQALFTWDLKHQNPVFTPLDHPDSRTPAQDLTGRPNHIHLISQLPSFGVIDNQNTHVLQSLDKGLEAALDPVVHGVTSHQSRI